MLNFTKSQIIEIKKASTSKLEKKVINVLLSKGITSEIESYIEDLLYGGCASGIEGSLIYYNDTCAFYKKYKNEIQKILIETLEESGLKDPLELFGKKWDPDDIFCNDTNNQNLFAWFGFEETVRKIAYQLEIEV